MKSRESLVGVHVHRFQSKKLAITSRSLRQPKKKLEVQQN